MNSPRSLVIGPDDLDGDFDAATIARGERYASERRIHGVAWVDDGHTLTGFCVGSGGHAYEVEVVFESPGDDVALEWVACSCPVGAYCKHAVALLLTAAAPEPRRAPPDHWRAVLGKVLDEMDARTADVGAPIGLEFSVAPPARYRPSATVTLRPVTVGKRGTWIKRGLSWRRVIDNPRAGEFDQRQYQAVRALATEVHRAYPVIVGEEMMLTGATRTLWPRLTAAADSGVTMVADSFSGLRAVEFIKSAHLRLDFAADEAGGALMSVTLVVDGEECAPDGVGLIGLPAPHGIYHVVDGVLRLGAFAPVPGRTLVDLIGRDEQVHIPAEMAEEFSREVLPRLSHVVPVEVEEGLFTPPTVTGPIPVLTVTMNGGGVRAYWSTRYHVNDQRHDFDPESPTGPTGYRDAAGEDLVWQRVMPALRAVAAASQSWKHQAAQHVTRRMQRVWNGAVVAEQRAIGEAADAAGAAAVASTTTLRAGVDLTLAQVAVLYAEILPQLECFGDLTIEIDEHLAGFRAAPTDPQLTFSSGDDEPPGPDWFDLNIAVQVDGHSVPLADVIAELAVGATHMLLPTGMYFRLDTPELTRLRELIEEARSLGEIDGNRVNARSLNVTLWDELLGLGVVDQQVTQWRQTVARLAAARPPVPVEVPAGLDAVLRDYQRDGLDWLSFLWDNELGGVLGDDMGLGKTVQTLALIARAVADCAGRFLVVAPTSVAGNWVVECDKFAPGLTAVAVTATDARAGVPLAEQVAAADVVVTSYTLLRMDFDAYAQMQWAGLILDEAQFVKNHNSKTHHCARRLDAGFKLAITGTPMENNLMELWSLLSITVPGLFPSPKVFNDYFRKPIEAGSAAERLSVLRRRIKPVMLRRTKGQVVAELPPKHEQVLTIELNAKHRKIYDTRLARERQKVLGLLGDWEKNRFQIFRSLTLLRQLSLHPGLVDESAIAAGSAKVDFLVEQLIQLVAEDHSALVFSQFTGFLGIVRSHLDAAGICYSYLDGSVPAAGRATAIAEFADGANRIFLISLKAGGFGLNLTSADYCFLCDPWWSPAAEAQAVDRAHRIGQTRPVTVYRLVSQQTIEEKVVALQERKRALFAAVVDEGDLFGSAVTASDVRELLD
jgi:superfamily II DNA or RNA helicase